ncbi:capsular polysaccharide synthesis protein [Azonexus sp.]|uniref:capsular polysaccharide synthesis protein n=1 Tax=Azonexus sp. TaxID=1872668 RepID=UPI0035B0C1F1
MIILRSIFSYKIAKTFWYKFRKIFSSKTTEILSPTAPKSFIWGNLRECNLPNTPKIIWTFWDGPESKCAEICQKSWEKNKSDFLIIRLNSSSIKKYISNFPKTPENIPIQLTTDLLRLMLLEKYGGIWLDYSAFLTTPLDWIIDLTKRNDTEALVFYNQFHDEYLNSTERPVIENGLIAARPQSRFIRIWRKKLEQCLFSDDYKTYFEKKNNYQELIKNFITKDKRTLSYLSCYISAQWVMLKSKNFRLTLINAEDEFYYTYYKTKPPRNRWRFAEELLLKQNTKKNQLPKILKITGGHRTVVDEYIKYNCFRENSLFGQFLYDRNK